MPGDERPLIQGWTANKESIESTQEFWEERMSVNLTSEDARECLYNMAAFYSVLQAWTLGPYEDGHCPHKNDDGVNHVNPGRE